MLVTCGAATTKCTAGDFIIIPRGVRHGYDVAAPGEKALLLTFDAPPYDPKKTVNVEPKLLRKSSAENPVQSTRISLRNRASGRG